ncbi:hypothetical protein Egran_03346 [Elaphomyces granulatus]|uniref:MARVEL domain-containing protein n=1 Tax=Elaphomyces granulatus TaxID=519963 RepID=A0A232LXK1_9EURO|nr:hypothetical protein Egran_03346 [Elaphomyces granulatus]
MWLITVIPRVFQFLFAIIVLGLSVSLAKGQVIGSVPATTGYGSFTGGLGILAAIVGFAALLTDFLEGIISWAIDGLACVAFLAGGIAFAVGLRGTDCSDINTTWNNAILSGGCDANGCDYFGGDIDHIEQTVKSRCTSAKADAAFMFLGFIFCMFVIAGSMFFSQNKRNRSGAVV